MQCKICGTEHDLFLEVAQVGVCSICKLKYIGGYKAGQSKIDAVRQALGLKEGEFLKQDNPQEAARILGRKA